MGKATLPEAIRKMAESAYKNGENRARFEWTEGCTTLSFEEWWENYLDCCTEAAVDPETCAVLADRVNLEWWERRPMNVNPTVSDALTTLLFQEGVQTGLGYSEFITLAIRHAHLFLPKKEIPS